MNAPRDGGAWFGQPIIYLGMLVLGVSIAACIVLIVIAVRYADTPIDAGPATTLPFRSTGAAGSRAP